MRDTLNKNISFKKYEFDYVLYTPVEEKFGNEEYLLINCEKIFNNQKFRVYKKCVE